MLINRVHILISPLSRRAFSGGKVQESLADKANTVQKVAAAIRDQARSINLNQASTNYLNAIRNAVGSSIPRLSPSLSSFLD
jgi:hypothetical protein